MPVTRFATLVVFVCCTATAFVAFRGVSSGTEFAATESRPAPEFTHTSLESWLNSPPLRMADLRGRVVLLDFWTFDCWNCYRSFPWLQSVEDRYGPKGLQVIGVHTPEFDHEKVRAKVQEKIKQFGLHHPVVMDNDFSYWRAMNNRYWPAYYLVDKSGVIRGVYIGETHRGDRRAQKVEAAIERLLAEP